uniref:stomatin-like protein 1 isoform X4 n=1 Tax=Jaculus jaculus TaxID=51337 RepID=UPI001E1B09BC|nr:stomatin-like protein 1 isoform X4 [Jaculus jaculus]
MGCASELALLPLPWPHQFPGVPAAGGHLPHLWLVCSKDRAHLRADDCVPTRPDPCSPGAWHGSTPALHRLLSEGGSEDSSLQCSSLQVLSVMAVKDLNTATRMTALNAMTKALLKRPLREIQTEKLKVGDQLLLEINDVTRAWGLEVDRVELAVEAVLQPPQDSPAGPSLDSTLQQLALHLLGGGLNSVARGALPPGPADTLEMVSEVEPPAQPADAGAAPSPEQPVAEGLLTALQPFLSEALVSQVGACYQFHVILPSGTQSIYFLDLTAGQGRVGHGVPDGIPDVVVEMTEADLRALLCRELRPLGAYMSGRLKVKGDLAVAMKLEAVLKALK